MPGAPFRVQSIKFKYIWKRRLAWGLGGTTGKHTTLQEEAEFKPCPSNGVGNSSNTFIQYQQQRPHVPDLTSLQQKLAQLTTSGNICLLPNTNVCLDGILGECSQIISSQNIQNLSSNIINSPICQAVEHVIEQAENVSETQTPSSPKHQISRSAVDSITGNCGSLFTTHSLTHSLYYSIPLKLTSGQQEGSIRKLTVATNLEDLKLELQKLHNSNISSVSLKANIEQGLQAIFSQTVPAQTITTPAHSQPQVLSYVQPPSIPISQISGYGVLSDYPLVQSSEHFQNALEASSISSSTVITPLSDNKSSRFHVIAVKDDPLKESMQFDHSIYSRRDDYQDAKGPNEDSLTSVIKTGRFHVTTLKDEVPQTSQHNNNTLQCDANANLIETSKILREKSSQIPSNMLKREEEVRWEETQVGHHSSFLPVGPCTFSPSHATLRKVLETPESVPLHLLAPTFPAEETCWEEGVPFPYPDPGNFLEKPWETSLERALVCMMRGIFARQTELGWPLPPPPIRVKEAGVQTEKPAFRNAGTSMIRHTPAEVAGWQKSQSERCGGGDGRSGGGACVSLPLHSSGHEPRKTRAAARPATADDVTSQSGHKSVLEYGRSLSLGQFMTALAGEDCGPGHREEASVYDAYLQRLLIRQRREREELERRHRRELESFRRERRSEELDARPLPEPPPGCSASHARPRASRPDRLTFETSSGSVLSVGGRASAPAAEGAGGPWEIDPPSSPARTGNATLTEDLLRLVRGLGAGTDPAPGGGGRSVTLDQMKEMRLTETPPRSLFSPSSSPSAGSRPFRPPGARSEGAAVSWSTTDRPYVASSASFRFPARRGR
ncbi:uncharacterized protein LOC111629086 [Centruroides sculpturatus]|uniref:uncharacterized protein LOC111629086 n=1 Tax=Centruroides sculpturatus TaxID=218467 RepID=UPI000C6E2177|nr:uncharacterized protein LOC111629086 [Centruroides sculpturatus]